MVEINIFICDRCKKARGYVAGIKTTKCTSCGKTHSIQRVLMTRKVWHARDEKEARKIIQELNWGK